MSTEKSGKKCLPQPKTYFQCQSIDFNDSQIGKIEKKVFLSCYCQEICRVEAIIGLKDSNYTWNLQFLNMWMSGQFLEKMIFCQ